MIVKIQNLNLSQFNSVILYCHPEFLIVYLEFKRMKQTCWSDHWKTQTNLNLGETSLVYSLNKHMYFSPYASCSWLTVTYIYVIKTQ